MKLSELLGAIGLPAEGVEPREIAGIQTLDAAGERDLSFFHDERYLASLQATKAAAVLLPSRYRIYVPKETVAIITETPYLHLAYATKYFAPTITTQSEPPEVGEGCDIDESVRFGRNVRIGKRVTIMAGVYLGDNVSIGDDALIYPNVTLYHDTQIGARCTIHAGTVIGSDGYGFAHTDTGQHVKLYQLGNVIIQDDVEIGANCAIDRAAFGSTVIEKGTKLDNLIQVAHNCRIGAYSLMAAQTGLAGSTTLGRNVVMGGQSGTAGHLRVGDFTTIAAKAGVTKTLEGGKTYAGFPAVEIAVWRKMQAAIMRLIKRKRDNG